MGMLPGSAGRRDLLLALGVAGLAQAEVWSGVVVGGPRPAVALSGLVMGVALAWRRRAPLMVLVLVFAAGTAQAALGVDSNTFLTPLLAMVVAVSSAAYHARRPFLALLAALALVWAAVLIENGPSPGDLLFAGLIVGGVWLAGHAVSIRQVRAQLLEARAAHVEREADWQAAAAVAEERRRIARELHDVVAHSLSVTLLHVGGVRRLLRPDQRAQREALLTAEQTGRQALQEMHRLLGVLRSPQEPPTSGPAPGLTQAGELLEPIRAGGLTAELCVEGTPRRLPPGVDLSAYRILQEALTNVLKHARATRVDCTIRYDDDAVRLDVVDDGEPQRGNGHLPDQGHGLIGMRERVALYRGTVVAGPVPGNGYHVAAVLPLPRQPP
ncbi:MAG TPA: histidine kinase [Pilimelia sp.]|nr:histidine kinase [Pilimelia sp.]